MQVRPKDSPTSSESGSNDASATVTIADPTTAAVGEKPNEKDDSPCRPKKKKKRASLEGKEAESTILNLMEAQQAAIEKADEKDERMFEALLKSQSDSQQRHQEFTLSVLGKLGEIFSSKKWNVFLTVYTTTKAIAQVIVFSFLGKMQDIGINKGTEREF